jgi:hypothetical protein
VRAAGPSNDVARSARLRADRSVDRRPLVADLQVGIAITISAVRIAFTQVFRTPEFEERDRFQQFDALSVSFRL